MTKLAVAILFCFVALSGCSQRTKGTADVSDPVFAVPAGTIPVYRLLNDKPEQDGNARLLRARIVVPTDLDRANLEANIRHAAKSLYDRDHPTGMLVFAYKEGTDVNGVYTAGLCDFQPVSKDKYDATVTLKDCEAKIDLAENYFQSAVSAARESDDAKFDQQKADETQRRSIYYEIGAANNRAVAEAERKYPDNFNAGQKAIVDQIAKRSRLEDDLAKRYETAVAKRHRLTYAEVQAIKNEGALANWPMPVSK